MVPEKVQGKAFMLLFVSLAILLPGAAFAGGKQEQVEGTEAATAGTKTEFAVYATPGDYRNETGETLPDYNEAPMLAKMVEAGELPPVDERLPVEPLVVQPIESVGKYGGTMNVFATSLFGSALNPWNDMQWGAGGADGLFAMTKDATDIEINLAKDYELTEDAMHFTIFLREGLKWSDGAPITADDVIFYYEDLVFEPEVPIWGGRDYADKIESIDKIDDYTVRLNFDQPTPIVLANMAQHPSWYNYQPKHYLKKWHIRYNPDADKIAKDEGFESWQLAIHNHYYWAPQEDVDLPVAHAFELVEKETTHLVFQRNPYYGKVDTEGNQFPYVDQIVAHVVDPEVYQLKVINGEADIAYIATRFEDYPLYRENEEAGNYRVILMPGPNQTGLTLSVNVNHADEILREVFGDARFRQALSYAIDREDINETLYFGLGRPSAATVLPSVSFFQDEWETRHAVYDPGEANRLLDDVGLTTRDSEGYRQLPNGDSLTVVVEHKTEEATPVLELVKEYWNDVGIRSTMKLYSPDLYNERGGAVNTTLDVQGRADFMLFQLDEMGFWLQGAPRVFMGSANELWYAPVWHYWMQLQNAKRRLEQAKTDNEVTAAQQSIDTFEQWLATARESVEGEFPVPPPEDFQEMYERLWDLPNARVGTPEFQELAQGIVDYHSRNVFLIGTVYGVPQPWIAKNYLRNVPGPDFVNRALLVYDCTGYGYQFYLDK